MNRIQVGIVQQTCTGNKTDNIDKSIKEIQKCASMAAEIVVLQELHSSLYFCQTEDTGIFDLSETIPGPSTELFSKTAKNAGVVLVTSLFEKRAAGLYHNTAVVFEKDGSIHSRVWICWIYCCVYWEWVFF